MNQQYLFVVTLLYLATVGAFLRARTFFAEPMVGYPMPAERSFDIDYPYQFRLADALMQERNHEEVLLVHEQV